MPILPEKGLIPLKGKIFFPRPIRDSIALVLTLKEDVKQQIHELDDSIVVGGADVIDKIEQGEFDISKFNEAYATTEMLPLLKPIARIMGTAGIMPTVKRGTVMDDLLPVLRQNFGAYNFREINNLLYIPVGRCDFSDEEIIKNLQAASKAIYGCQGPATKKPSLIGHCHISSTHGPAAVIDFRT